MNYSINLKSYEGEDECNITLPFIPYPGLHLKVPFARMDYQKIDAVYWDSKKQQFEVFMEL